MERRNWSDRNRAAWTVRAYEYWCKHTGPPSEAARRMRHSPEAFVRRHIEYFGALSGKRVLNLFGSNGRKAVPLALLGASVTVIDFSRENMRYAMELAEHAGVTIRYLCTDIFDIEVKELAGAFDLVYAEGGILHYVSDLQLLMSRIADFLRTNGTLVLDDFHPFARLIVPSLSGYTLEGDYFSPVPYEAEVAYAPAFSNGERAGLPRCLQKHWRMGEIVTAVAAAGMRVEILKESRHLALPHIPGYFTLVAERAGATGGDGVRS